MGRGALTLGMALAAMMLAVTVGCADDGSDGGSADRGAGAGAGAVTPEGSSPVGSAASRSVATTAPAATTSTAASTSASATASRPEPTTTATRRPEAVYLDDGTGALVGAHDCVEGPGRIAWDELRNPVFGQPHMVKDQAIRLVDGRWHLYFSERPVDEADRTGHWTSADLTGWEPSALVEPWSSPDVTRGTDGRLVITHQLVDPDNADLAKIFWRTSERPEGPWSPPERLVPGLFDAQRLIDAALAHTEHGLFLVFKRGLRASIEQFTEVAWSASGSLDGPWGHLGQADVPWSESYQLLPIDGVWHMLVTLIPFHEPTLFRLVGDPADPQSWLHWQHAVTLEVPAEAWNDGEQTGITHERSNSAYLCDARTLDGYWYLFFAGSTELTTFDGRGHAKIGLARSTDLVSWEVPPGP